VDENGLDDGEVAISELWSVGSGTRQKIESSVPIKLGPGSGLDLVVANPNPNLHPSAGRIVTLVKLSLTAAHPLPTIRAGRPSVADSIFPRSVSFLTETFGSYLAKMVFYFTSNVVDPPAYVYVGKDKFESE
jgi:hypothetical protein